jgi:hypothetical protein
MALREVFWSAWAILALCVMCPLPAAADSSVVVLGVRSLDGDDDLAHDISLALRTQAQKMSGWSVSQRDVSLAQMSLAHGCEEPDARCMADIAGTLEVDRLIYGTVLKTGEEVQLSLFNFDAVTGQVESSFSQKVQAAELADPALSATMTTLLKRLAGEKVAGMLRVTSDTPGAKVTLDGNAAGSLDVRGELLLTEVAAGTHALLVEAASGRKELSVDVSEGNTQTVRVALRTPLLLKQPGPVAEEHPDQPEPVAPKRSWRRIGGWSSIGLAGGLALATVITWVRIDGINNEHDLKAYRAEFPPPDKEGGASDVCKEADHGTLANNHPGDADKAALESSARDLCHRAHTLEVLQYVFLGGAGAAGAVGAYLLLSTPKAKKPPTTLSFSPSVGQNSGSLAARIRF